MCRAVEGNNCYHFSAELTLSTAQYSGALLRFTLHDCTVYAMYITPPWLALRLPLVSSRLYWRHRYRSKPDVKNHRHRLYLR